MVEETLSCFAQQLAVLILHLYCGRLSEVASSDVRHCCSTLLILAKLIVVWYSCLSNVVKFSTARKEAITYFTVQNLAHAREVHCWYDSEVTVSRFVRFLFHLKACQVHSTELIT